MRTVLVILIILLVVAGVKAQIPAGGSISIQVSATVLSDSPIELTTLSNMVLNGAINEKQEIYISPISNPHAGLMRVKGKPGSRARVNYILKEVLSHDNGNNSITMNYEMSGYPEMVQRAAVLIDTGEVLLDFGSDGLYYLWVGGRANVSKAAPGKYTGQFTIEIEYL
jgi:hypothetical protein